MREINFIVMVILIFIVTACMAQSTRQRVVTNAVRDGNFITYNATETSTDVFKLRVTCENLKEQKAHFEKTRADILLMLDEVDLKISQATTLGLCR